MDASETGPAAPAARRPSLPVADGFELDLAGRVLRHGSEPVHLRPIEFRLLAALAGAPGRAFTRRQLLETAWPSRQPVDLRTVDVHVHWLRIESNANHRGRRTWSRSEATATAWTRPGR